MNLICREVDRFPEVCTRRCIELRQNGLVIEQLAALEQDEVRCACCEQAHVSELEVVVEHEEVLEILHGDGRHFRIFGHDGV
jgi:hypothetical protein